MTEPEQYMQWLRKERKPGIWLTLLQKRYGDAIGLAHHRAMSSNGGRKAANLDRLRQESVDDMERRKLY